MKRAARIIAFAVVILITTAVTSVGTRPSVGQPALSKSATDEGADHDVRRAGAMEVKAFLEKDDKTLASLWSNDMVVTNPLNKFVTKQQVLGMIQSGVLIMTDYDRQDDYVRVYGDTVIVAGRETVTWGGKMPNAGKTDSLRFTAIWMKREGHWKEVARHANVVPPTLPR